MDASRRLAACLFRLSSPFDCEAIYLITFVSTDKATEHRVITF
jgi:hypothetical protein